MIAYTALITYYKIQSFEMQINKIGLVLLAKLLSLIATGNLY